MQITKPETYSLRQTNLNLARVWEDIYKLTQRNISFGTTVNGSDQNIAGQMVEIANTGVINTQFVVVHNLGRIPLYYDVKYINVIGTVYDSGTPWTKTKAFFKCSIANAKVRLFIH